MMSPILQFTFEPMGVKDRSLVHEWLLQPHIAEWIHGIGLQNTLNGIEKFLERESDTTYWIGYDNSTPFAFLITSPEGNDATTLDLFICNLNYLGKGIAVRMIREFLIRHFSNMNKVLIDPEATNKRAIHVYQKVGFKITGEFIASWHPVPHYQMELDMKDLVTNEPDGYKNDLLDIRMKKRLTIDPINRPKISIYIATSIDGYIARKDGGLDWLDRVGGFDEDYGFQKLLSNIDALIIGRKTYEVAITVPDPYPGKRVVVLSNSLNSVRKDMELYRGDLVELLIKLHKDGIKHIWIDGGTTISQFLAYQMVDTMTLSIIPVILGSGIPLFNVIDKEISCHVVSSQAYPSGLVQLRYEIIQQPDISQKVEKG